MRIVLVVPKSMFDLDRFRAMTRVLNLEGVGWAGISWDGLLPGELEQLGTPSALRVAAVAPTGPADRAGLKVGDFIVGLQGAPFESAIDFQSRTASFVPGQTISLDVIREGKPHTISITLGTWQEVSQLEIDGVGF